MKQVRLESTLNTSLGYNNVQRVGSNIYKKGSKYPMDRKFFMLDENANWIDDSIQNLIPLIQEGKVKAIGFKATDSKYYAVNIWPVHNATWGPYGAVNNITLYENMYTALRDFKGEQNTTEIINQLGSDTLAGNCRDTTFNGKQGFLPSMGQLADFMDIPTNIEIGGSNTLGNYLVIMLNSLFGYYPTFPYTISQISSSTQYSYQQFWYYDFGEIHEEDKRREGAQYVALVFHNLD